MAPGLTQGVEVLDSYTDLGGYSGDLLGQHPWDPGFS